MEPFLSCPGKEAKIALCNLKKTKIYFLYPQQKLHFSDFPAPKILLMVRILYNRALTNGWPDIHTKPVANCAKKVARSLSLSEATKEC